MISQYDCTIQYIIFCACAAPLVAAASQRISAQALLGEGQMGSALVGSLQTSYIFVDRGTFWVLPLTSPKVPGRIFFPNLSKFITFAVALLVWTPSVRSQPAPAVRFEPFARRIPVEAPCPRSFFSCSFFVADMGGSVPAAARYVIDCDFPGLGPT